VFEGALDLRVRAPRDPDQKKHHDGHRAHLDHGIERKVPSLAAVSVTKLQGHAGVGGKFVKADRERDDADPRKKVKRILAQIGNKKFMRANYPAFSCRSKLHREFRS